MAIASSSMSFYVECVNVCKLWNGGDVSGKYECSAGSCAWKAPRAFTGFLASTTAPTSSYSSHQHGRKYGFRRDCEVQYNEGLCQSQYPDIVPRKTFFSNIQLCRSCRKWKLHCSSSVSPEPFEKVSPDSLWEKLAPTISYLSTSELEFVRSALNLAFEAHEGQRRRSGEPFIIHPVAVAQILGELELDWESIAAGLLHDTVEDTNFINFERIEEEFGSAVRHIVEGETKVSKLGKLKYTDGNHSLHDVKADDLRQMFLAMTEEVRVIIVKLADRLHNMRTLSHMPPHKQASIAVETLQVFAPLAKLLGMYQIKSELENLAFKYTNALDYAKIERRIAELYKEHEMDLLEAKKVLLKKIENDQFLDLMTVKIEVNSICREPYSIYRTVLKANNSINEVNQVAQLRIIIKPKPCVGVGPLCNAQQICYHVLGLVHGIWTPIPRAMKDYIATPKPNGYQSLHTIVIPFLYESTFRLEVQIRTEEMNLIAERGIAAHYSGKGLINGLVGHVISYGGSSRGKTVCLNNTNIARRISWLNAIREWQEEFVGNMSSREFVDTVTKDLLGSRVFVFTPRGEIKHLPKGSTIIDYAYTIHTEIGNTMVAAKVNGNLVSPLRVLANAEVVEIITYKGLSGKSAFQRHKQWLQHAKTRSARHKIMKFLKEQAANSAVEITADSVREFVAKSEQESEADCMNSSEGIKNNWGEILKNLTELSSVKIGHDSSAFQIHPGNLKHPKINGKHNKHMQHVSLNTKGEMLSEMVLANLPVYREVLPGLENWKGTKIALWHKLEGHSIQWFCVVCFDQKGMMGEITSAMSGAGINICSCVAEVDRMKSMGVMLFHIEASFESLVSIYSRMDLMVGVLGWSMGCSWPSSVDSEFLEC